MMYRVCVGLLHEGRTDILKTSHCQFSLSQLGNPCMEHGAGNFKWLCPSALQL